MSEISTIAAVPCPRCHSPIPPDQFNSAQPWTCFVCGATLQVRVFPALLKAAQPGKPGQPLTNDGESGCFYHPAKVAVVPCDGCGRFLCSLCDIPVGNRHVCPNCIKPAGQGSDETDTRRFLYDSLAVVLALTPLVITPLLALYMAIRLRRRPISVTQRSGAWWVLGVVLAIGQLGVWTVLLARHYVALGGPAQ